MCLLRSQNIVKVSPTTSTIKEPGKSVIMVCNTIFEFWNTEITTLGLNTVLAGNWLRSKEKTHSQVREVTQNLEATQKVKHKKREPGSWISSSKSNITRGCEDAFQKLQASQPSETVILHPLVNRRSK